ncbi:MAG TPA: hypothetical protein VK966_06265 [Longimicrobiales bacterium]|nr:hypothetical protein [Longimicrobiales bacterium]
MLCDHCGENEAVIHLTQIVDNEMGTFHLCEACAAEKGLEPEPGSANFPLTDFLAQMGQEGRRASSGQTGRPLAATVGHSGVPIPGGGIRILIWSPPAA